MELRENAPLGPLTTFKIGGPARFLVRVFSNNDLRAVLTFARSKKLPIFVLGGGSNVLIDDAGFEGVVIKMEFRGLELQDTLVVAAAGESWDKVVTEAITNNLWGIENLSGVPGTIGGAAVQNIGAYGQALSQTVEWVEVFDIRTDVIKRFTNADCAFGYRTSAMKRGEDRFIVLRVALRLSKEARPDVSYKDLTEAFKDVASPALEDIRAKVLAIRAKKFPDLSKEGTAGSFFKNPILPQEEAEQLRLRYPEMPVFPLPESSGVKVPLAWLLDHALSLRGLRHGAARLYEAQPLVIATEGNASSEEVIALAKEVQEKVKEVCGIEIEPEVKILQNGTK